MNSHQRTVFLAVLIPFAFGALTFIETGGFILPFPLNEMIFAITAFIFVFRLFRSEKIISLFILLFSGFNLLSTEFIWSLFSTQESLQYYYESGVFDTMRFFSYLMLLAWLIRSFLIDFKALKLVLLLIIVSLFSIGLINQWYYLMVVATFIPFVVAFKFSYLKPFHLLWLLLSILNTMTLVMFQMAKA
ncbi:MAG: hypothetical protein V4638_09040 [Bacteroidota bacterium]